MSGQDQGSLILKSGLNQIYDTGVFPSFSLKYFLPVYDARTDLEIHDLPFSTVSPSTTAIPNSASVFNVDISSTAFGFGDIEGELLWNNSTVQPDLIYKLDYDGNIITGATADPTNSLNASTNMNSKKTKANYVYNTSTSTNMGRPAIGTPFSSAFQQYKGDNVVSNGNGSFSSTINFVQVAEVTPIPTTWNAASLYDSIDYISNIGDPDEFGVYQIRLPANTGSFQFNKIILFAQKVNTQGVDEAVDPFPFAVVTLNETQTKLNSTDPDNSNNVTEFIAEVSIAFTRTASGASEITYNPLEYWTRIKTISDGTSALEYPGSVLISPINGGVNEVSPKSKLHLIEDDITKSIIRFSRQESSNSNDGNISINPNTSSVQIYTEEATRGFEFGDTAAAVSAGSIAIGPLTSGFGNYSYTQGDNLDNKGNYNVLIGSNTNMLPSPPQSVGFNMARNITNLSTFNSIVLAQDISASTPISFMDTLALINDPLTHVHSNFTIYSSMINHVVPKASNINYRSTISNTIGATTSGEGIYSSLTIGETNNYDTVRESVLVGNDMSLQGAVESSIIVGANPSMFNGPTFGNQFGTSGCLYVAHNDIPNIMYNQEYKNCFFMAEGAIIGGGLQPTSESTRNSMFLWGSQSMIAADYSVVMGRYNLMNSAPTQIQFTSQYYGNYILGQYNNQNGLHTTAGYDFNRGIFTIGSRIYTEDCRDTFVIGGELDAVTNTYATDGDNKNSVKRTEKGYVIGVGNSIRDINSAYAFGSNATMYASQESYQFGRNNTTGNSVDTFTTGAQNSQGFALFSHIIGSNNNNTHTNNCTLLGNSNSFLGFTAAINIRNSYAVGEYNAILGSSLFPNGNSQVYMFGNSNSAQSTTSAYIVGSENSTLGNNTNAFTFGASNATSYGTNTIQVGISNTSVSSTNTYQFGKNMQTTSADGSYMIGNTSVITRLSGGTAAENYLIGNSNKVESGTGSITNTFMYGILNEIHTKSSQQPGLTNANVLIGSTNIMSAIGAQTPSPTIHNSTMFGVLNIMYAGVYADIDNSMILGERNEVNVQGATSDTFVAGLQVLGSNNDMQFPTTNHDISVRSENGVTVIGTNGDLQNFTSVSKIFKVWDQVQGTQAPAAVIYKNNTDAMLSGDSSYNKMNVLITNGLALDNDAYRMNAIGIGAMDIGVTLGYRQMIVLPVKHVIASGSGTNQMTSNPLNPTNTEYSMPTLYELGLMKASGAKRPPMGTLCYDDGTSHTLPAGDYTSLNVWLGQN